MSQPPQTPPPPPSGAPEPSDAWSAPPPQQPMPPVYPQSQRTNGLAIAALVCGIFALLLSWIPFVNVLAFVLGLVAIGCGIAGIMKAGAPDVGQKGLAVGGLVTGILAVVLSVLILVGIAAIFSSEEFQEPFDRIIEGEDPQDVLEDLERQLDQQR